MPAAPARISKWAAKFFAIPLGDIIVFGVLVGAAILQRQLSDTHKRLMLLATSALLTAAVARFLRQVGMGRAPNLFYAPIPITG